MVKMLLQYQCFAIFSTDSYKLDFDFENATTMLVFLKYWSQICLMLFLKVKMLLQY